VNIVYVGFVTCELENCEEYMTLPNAPINYKDPVKIKEYIDKALEAKKANAKNSPLMGFLQSWCILGSNGAKVTDSLKAPRKLLEELIPYDVIAGYRIFDLMDMAVVDHIFANGHLPVDLHWAKLSKMNKFPFLSPPWVNSKAQKIIFDPVDSLCGQDAVDNPSALARRFDWKEARHFDTAEELAQLSFLAGSKFFKG